MKIHEYNEMMAYLTRPAVNRTGYGEGDLVKKSQLKEVLSRYGITPSDTNFSRVAKRLGVEISRGGTQPVYIEPSVEKLQEMKTQFDADQLKVSRLGKGKEAFEQRKIKVAEIIREADGDITLKQIQNFFKDGKVPQYAVVHEVSKNIGIDIIDSRRKGPLNVKTKEIIKDLNILKNNDKLNAIINKPGFDVVEDLLELEKITAEAIPNSKASPARRVAQLLMAYSGDDPELKSYVEKGGFKISDDLAMAADTITPGMRSSGEYSLIRHLDRMAAEQKGAIAIGKEETGFFASQRKRLQEAIRGIAPGIRGLFQIDEIKPISGMRSNTPIYNIFTQGILKELNKKKLNVLDKETTKAELALQKATTKAEKIKIIEEYNEKVGKFVKDVNKNLKPGELPVRAFELSLDEPSKTIKNTEAYTQYKDYFDDIHTRHGYSFKVPKDVMTSEQAQTFLASGKGKSIILKRIKSLLQSADTNQITKIREVLGCPRLFSSGGRIGFVKGGNLLDCPMKKLAENPEAVLNKIGQEMPQTRSPITNMFKQLGMGSMKWAGNTFNVALGPTGVVGLNYFLGVDPTKTADRIGLEAELAFAKPLVEGAKSVTDKIKTPFLRKAAETAAGIRIPSLPGRAAIMTPANALRLARIASPIGWAALGAEGAYHGGKYMLERKKLLESLTDEQRDELLRKEKQEAVMQQTRGDPEAFDYLAAAEGGRVGFGGGGKIGKAIELGTFVFKSIRDLYKGKKGLQTGRIEKELMKKYRDEGMEFGDAVTTANREAYEIVDARKLEIVQDAMKKVDMASDDYIKLMDEELRLTDYEMYEDIKRWDNTRPDLADKTRALHFPEWAASRFGENYDEVLLSNQARALKAQSDEIDRMYPADDPDVGPSFVGEQQMVDEIDEMNKANLAELLEGKKKHAVGGRVGLKEGSPKSPSRRAFLKGITALAALPVVGKFFKLGKVLEAGKYTGPTIEKIKGMPEWFPSLVKKLWNEGEDVTKTYGYEERLIVKKGTLEGGDEVNLYYHMDSGDVSIDVAGPKVGKQAESVRPFPYNETTSGSYNQPYALKYKVGQMDETTKGQKPPDEFSVDETELHRSGPEPDDVEFYGNETNVDDAISDLTELEAFAKNKTTKQIYKKKGTKPKDLNPSEPDVDWDDIYNPYD